MFGCIPVDQAIEETANKDTLDSRGHEMIQFKPLISRQMLPNSILISISTTSAASPDIYMTINAKRERKKDFQKSHLEENAYDFYERQPKLKLKTFRSLEKIKKDKRSWIRCNSKSR